MIVLINQDLESKSENIDELLSTAIIPRSYLDSIYICLQDASPEERDLIYSTAAKILKEFIPIYEL